MRKLILSIVLGACVLMGVYAEYVPVKAEENTLIFEKETGELVYIISGYDVVPIKEIRNYVEGISLSFPEWMQGIWREAESNEYIFILTNDMSIQGVSFRVALLDILLDYYGSSYFSPFVIGKELEKGIYFLSGNGEDIIFRQTTNPNLILATDSSGDTIALVREGSGFASTLTIPEWLQGIWFAENGMMYDISGNDVTFGIPGEKSQYVLSDLFLSNSLVETALRTVYVHAVSDSSDDNSYTITFGDTVLKAKKTDNPDEVILSQVGEGEWEYVLTRYKPSIWL